MFPQGGNRVQTLQHFGIYVKSQRKYRQEGTGKYNEYIRYMFKTYLSSKNLEFNMTIKRTRRWNQDLLDKDYSLTDLTSTASKTYNNIVVDEGFEEIESKLFSTSAYT